MQVEVWPIEKIFNNPRNYRRHPEEQIGHIKRSLELLGQFKNVVVDAEGMLLAGHGVAEAARASGWTELTVHVFNGTPEQAKLLMVADNEISQGVDDDERLLTELLKEINDDMGLLGTGYDEMQLANVVLATRDESEIPDFDAAAEWVGLPDYDPLDNPRATGRQMVVQFENDKDREDFAALIGLKITDKTKATWWPIKANEKTADLIFEGDAE